MTAYWSGPRETVRAWIAIWRFYAWAITHAREVAIGGVEDADILKTLSWHHLLHRLHQDCFYEQIVQHAFLFFSVFDF